MSEKDCYRAFASILPKSGYDPEPDMRSTSDRLIVTMTKTHDKVLDPLGPALLHWHLRFSVDTSVEEYISKYKAQVDRGMAFTKAVYLDTNYWVRLRDAELGKGTVAGVALLGRLRSLVAARKIICVSHLTSMLEIAKQLENSARTSTALVDELTERVTLAPTTELDALEIENYVRAKLGATHPSSSLQWTCLGQIFKSKLSGGNVLPANLGNDGQAVLKSAADALWNQGLTEIFEAFGWNTKNHLQADLDPEALVRVEERKKTRPYNGNLKKTCEAEFEDVMEQHIELFEAELLKLLGPIGAAALGAKSSLAAQGLARHALADYQSGTLGRHLPGFVIRTELSAMYECDPAHTLSTNDWQDWQHASVALPYCDFFLTEKRLAHQVTKILHLDTKYQCRVVGPDMDAALAALDGLNQ